MTAKPQVAPQKIIEYLLNPNHPVGRDKAAFFIAFGFSRERPDELATALIQHYEINQITESRPGRYGGVTNVCVDAPMTMPNGRAVNLRSCWYFSEDDPTVRLSTAYPLDEA